MTILLLTMFPASGNTVRPLPFRAGERLEYVIRYGVIHAGFSTLVVEEGPAVKGHRTWKISSQAWSNKVMDVLYRVRDKNESWMDREGLYSRHFEQDLHEGSFSTQRWVDYDYERGRFTRVEQRKGTETRKEGPLPAHVQDVFSSLYYTRTLPLELGKTYEFLANSDAKNWTLRVVVLRKETVHVQAGQFSCLVVEPILLSEGIFKHKGRLFVWITNDAKRIPVLVRSQVAIGAVSAELVKREGN
jgi:hypothetical protein